MLRMTGLSAPCPPSCSLAYLAYMWSMYWGGTSPSLSPESGDHYKLSQEEVKKGNLNMLDRLIHQPCNELLGTGLDSHEIV